MWYNESGDKMDNNKYSFNFDDSLIDDSIKYIKNSIANSEGVNSKIDTLNSLAASVSVSGLDLSASENVKTILTDLEMDTKEIAQIISAIGNHDESTGIPISGIAAALIIIFLVIFLIVPKTNKPKTTTVPNVKGLTVSKAKKKITSKGLKVKAVVLDDPKEAEGVNNKIELAEANRWMQDSINRKWMEKGGEIRRNYCAEAVKNIIQAFQGIKEVFIMGRRKYFVKEFENAYSKQLSASIIQGVGNECPAYIIEGICVTGLLGYICICVAGGNIDTESMVVSLAVFAMGAFRILPSLGRISTTFNTIVFYARSMDEMYNNLELARETTKEEEISDREIEFIDSLKIEGLYWKYSEEADYVLEDINLEIKKGDSIAFVGQSGSGKTTLVDLIMGLLKPQRGLITLDGLDILELGNSWRKLIGYVPQNIYLIDDSIRNNIAFGIPEEKIDDEKVWKALELAQLKEFVKSQKDGLDCQVGDRGVRFSGGQRQRMAIARALYEEPEIIILDEATAALDNETEIAVMESIENLKGIKTLIIIAHRLTTIKNCNRICEIVDGKIKDRTYGELVK